MEILCGVKPSERQTSLYMRLLYTYYYTAVVVFECFLMEFSWPLCLRAPRPPANTPTEYQTGLLKHLILLNSKNVFMFFFLPPLLYFLVFCLFISDVECKNQERTLALPHQTTSVHLCVYVCALYA